MKELIPAIIWFLVFMITTIWLSVWIEENNKNFGWTLLYAFSYLMISWIVIKLMGF